MPTERQKKKRENPFDDYSDWVEIGTRPYGQEPENDDFQNIINRRTAPLKRPEVLTYFGKDLNFTTEQIVAVFTKRFPYFNTLSVEKKNIFLNRHKRFLKNKTLEYMTKVALKKCLF